MSARHLEPKPLCAAEPTSPDAAVARIITRASAEYVLRAFQLLIDAYGDIRAALLMQAICTANIAGRRDDMEASRRISAVGVYPDELRRPISLARLADSAGVPFESTRRLVQHLVDTGVCVRVDGGVIVPGAALAQPQAVRSAIANVGYVGKFMRDLHGAGFAEQLPLFATKPVNAARDMAFTRFVARSSMEYVLRYLHLLARTFGEIRAGVVAQTIIAANTAHLDVRGAGAHYAALGETPPDALRRPVSVARLAESLGAPYETMRRKVDRLVDAGICIRADGGVLVPAAVVEQPECVQAMLDNVGYVRKLVRELIAGGV